MSISHQLRCFIIYMIELYMVLAAAGMENSTNQWLFRNPCGSPSHNPNMPASNSTAVTTNYDNQCAWLCGQDPACAGYAAPPCVLYAERGVGCSVRGPEEPQAWIKHDGTAAALTCPPPFELSTVTQSCYLYQLTNKDKTWSELQQECGAYGAHLWAVNNAEEHDWINSYLDAKAGSCETLWTGGKRIPTNTDVWEWHVGGGAAGPVTEPDTFVYWREGQPNNQEGIENVIMLWNSPTNFTFEDLPEDCSAKTWEPLNKVCYICETKPIVVY